MDQLTNGRVCVCVCCVYVAFVKSVQEGHQEVPQDLGGHVRGERGDGQSRVPQVDQGDWDIPQSRRRCANRKSSVCCVLHDDRNGNHSLIIGPLVSIIRSRPQREDLIRRVHHLLEHHSADQDGTGSGEDH